MKHIWLSYLMIIVGAIILVFQPLLEGQLNLSAFSQKKDADYTWIIDPGHGGEDGGATGVTGVLEKGVNLNISHKLEALLGFYGYNTVLTRSGDESIHNDEKSVRKRKIADIKNRVKLVKNTDNPILLSIHLNFFSQPECKGAQVFYSANNEKSKELAESIQRILKSGINDNNNRSVKQSGKNIYLLNNVDCPAVLVECGFLSNPNEESLLATQAYQTKIAVCITSGCLEYMSQK